MIPILYTSVTEGTVPTHFGVGPLSDCISCTVKEERNGAYELEMEYAVNGVHASDIQVNAVIKAKSNFTDFPQIFRIYKVGKNINGSFTVNAAHITYDLSGKLVDLTASAGSCTAACALLQTKAGNFTINTDISSTKTFKTSPGSVRSFFGGREGSLIDLYGGEWYYDNFECRLKSSRGTNRGAVIRYGKNLTELSQEIDLSNLCTGILPFAIGEDGTTYTAAKVSTGLVSAVTRDQAIDFSDKIDWEGTAVATQLTSLANAYVSSHSLVTPDVSITLDFVQAGNIAERVDLCDTVTIYFEALGISASMKCVKTVWDVLQERYTSTTFGAARSNIADTIAEGNRILENTASRSYLAEAVTHATDMITGNLGGYVVIHDSNNDGEPDEILIMDTDDISTATKVWRWNKNGLGYSSTGYSGTYGLAMTADGEIVADFITTGTLNANVIKAGIISDAGNNFSIDFTSGNVLMKKLKAVKEFKLVDGANYERAFLRFDNGTTTFSMNDGASKDIFDVQGTTNGARLLKLYNKNQKTVFNVGSETALGNNHLYFCDSDGHILVWFNELTEGGIIRLYNCLYSGGEYTGQNEIFAVYANSNSGASAVLKDMNGTVNILMSGDTGNVRCVSLTQTSSRKVKKNIKPIEDASKILELDAVSFDYKNEALGTDKRGFIAEDVAKVLPNLVTEETEDAPATLDYIGMIAYLQEVVKEQDKRIKALEDRLSGTDNS